MPETLTYPLFAAGILLSTALFSVLSGAQSLRKPGLWLSTLILVVLTIIFDNLIVGFQIVTYDPNLISGWKIGVIPIEDLSYALAAPFLIDTISHLIRRHAR